jgi:hydroxysqualene dehydroxylase
MPEASKAKHVAIIGGGMAGLAAACLLASRGIPITLFEASANLGGRARRVDYKEIKLDNGQHILLGAYAETLNLLKLAGVQESQVFMRLPLQLSMLDLANKSTFSLKACSALPAPLHILFGLLSAKGLSFNSRLSAIKLMVWMKLNSFKLASDEPLANFLQAKNQSETLIKNLWEPLCLAALNTPLNLASTQIFLNVLRDSFDKKKADSDMLLPRVDLSALLAEPLAAYIAAHGGEIKTSHAVRKIQKNDSVFTVTCNDVDEHFNKVIIACAPHQLSNLDGNLNADLSIISNQVAYFHYQPITTVYLQYLASTKLPQAMIGLVTSVSQWVFDKGQISDQDGLMAVVISAHAPLEITQDDLAAKVITELTMAFPQLDNPLWTKVITEKRATFSCDARLKRPISTTNIANLYLAGDYVAAESSTNNYPATIEGAVRSGLLAAAHILAA